MNILTFDTSLDKTYVSLSSDGEMLVSKVIENHNEKYHSAFLIPTIVSILKKYNITMKDIDVIGTNIGPGSFTGIRACVTVARVFAQQLNIPLVGISSLEILSKINNTNSKTLLVLDARKKQYYTATYKNGQILQEPMLVSQEDLLKLDFSDSVIISDETGSRFLSEHDIGSLIYTEQHANLGVFLNEIVFNKIKTASDEDYYWSKLKPLYLQAPPVTVSSKNKVC